MVSRAGFDWRMSRAEDAVGHAAVVSCRAHGFKAVTALVMTSLDDLQDYGMGKSVKARLRVSSVARLTYVVAHFDL